MLGVLGIGVLYIFFMLTGSLLASTIHLTYCMLFFCYVTYQELYLRLFPTATQERDLPAMEEGGLEPSLGESIPAAPDELWMRLERYMCDEEPWRSPNITAEEVAKAVGCSRSTLLVEISSQQIGSFYRLVAQYRIDAFCDMARKNEIANVNEALFSVGFRSRTTAYERFKEQMGVTPAEYIKTIKGGGV